MSKSKGSVALVTGAFSGIREAAAERLAKAGSKGCCTSRRGARARERPFELLPLGVMSDGYLLAEVEQRELRIDLLVNKWGLHSRLSEATPCSPAASR